jgi:hypothetical protein
MYYFKAHSFKVCPNMVDRLSIDEVNLTFKMF